MTMMELINCCGQQMLRSRETNRLTTRKRTIITITNKASTMSLQFAVLSGAASTGDGNSEQGSSLEHLCVPLDTMLPSSVSYNGTLVSVQWL